ncbi:hypothetical protein VNO80_31595 [Phaseolus coccineus]|uniref:RHOMBOID-like protein n=1 Tax=Phaseolus coccineus TaxID=3886 RepID=A0AAN9Q729_PHACN
MCYVRVRGVREKGKQFVSVVQKVNVRRRKPYDLLGFWGGVVVGAVSVEDWWLLGVAVSSWRFYLALVREIGGEHACGLWRRRFLILGARRSGSGACSKSTWSFKRNPTWQWWRLRQDCVHLHVLGVVRGADLERVLKSKKCDCFLCPPVVQGVLCGSPRGACSQQVDCLRCRSVAREVGLCLLGEHGRFGGSVLSSLFIIDHISVGASGALFGLLRAMPSELITNCTIYFNKMSAMTLLTLLVIIVINLGIDILPHVDNFAHIGGFLVGFLLSFILLPRP